jgi:acetoin utilization deacetylase AcuC-like enzyme
MSVLVCYHKDFSILGYPYLKYRIKPSFQVLQEIINEGLAEVFEPKITDETMRLADSIHSWQHITDVKNSGYYEVSLLSLAGVVQSAERIITGEYSRGFAYVGAAGHHASPVGFWGFCYLNDVAAAITRLRELGKEQFLILDVDPHFGDGTRNFFKRDEKVVHINFYAGNKDEFNENSNNYDYALSYKATDEEFEEVLDRALDRAFDFDMMFVIFGHDSHALDYGGFALSYAAYPILARKVKEYAKGRPLLWVLSGGAKAEVACRTIPDIVGVLAE